MEDNNPAPTHKQFCRYPMMTPVDDRTRMCQNCGMEEVYQLFEHAQGEVPLERKKGPFGKGKIACRWALLGV